MTVQDAWVFLGNCLQDTSLAQDLLSAVLRCSRYEFWINPERMLTQTEENQLNEWTFRLQGKEPLAYLEGNISFLGETFFIDSRALIPRAETELLVEMVLNRLKDRKRLRVLDLCCGSGCIGLTLKKRRPDWEVVLSDLSLEAIALCRENQKKLGVDVTILQGDLLMPCQGMVFDLIVCNPPYVSFEEYEALDESVRCFEPKMALVAQEGGTSFYRRLAFELLAYLKLGSQVFLEMGMHQGKILQDLFSSPPWTCQQIFLDWAQKERFFFLEVQSNSL